MRNEQLTSFHNQETKELPYSHEIIGFGVKSEVKSITRNIKNGLKEGLSPNQAVKRSLLGTEENMESWGGEYGEDRPFIPGHYSYRKINGEDRLVDKTGFPLVDGVLEEERGGEVKRFVQKVENFFKPPKNDNKMVIGFSPEGDSGLFTDDNQKIVFPDSYIYLIKEEKGELKTIIVRTNLNILECQALLNRLLIKYKPGEPLPNDQNLVASSLFLTSNDTDFNFGDVVDELLEVKPTALGEKVNTNSKAQELLKDYDQAFTYRNLCQQYIAEIEQLITENFDHLNQEWLQNAISNKLKEVMIRLTLAIKGVETSNLSLTQAEYNLASKAMSKMHGCAGSGVKESKDILEYINSFGGWRVGQGETWHLGECSQCGAGNGDNKVEVSCGLCRNCARIAKEQEKLGIPKAA